MVNAELLGRRIAEALVNDTGPCLYPGKFKPPHKGHYQAAKALAAKDFITQVIVIISRKVIDDITPEDSLAIWNMYLKAEPNPKITVRISTDESPVVTMIKYLQNHPETDPVYVAVGDDEIDDAEYGKALQEKFGKRVKIANVQEKAGNISAPRVRNILATGDFEAFKEAVPEAAYNKGAAPKIFKMLATKVKGDGQEEA